MRTCVCILLSLAACFNCFAGRPTLHWLAGNWEGTGGDVNTSFNWTITLSYKENDESIVLTYPSHNCGGSLKIVTIETGKATCMEDVNYGLGQCNSGLKVLIKQETDGTISLAYYYVGNANIKSTARLRRI
jgi:hypothetical protein